MICWAFLFIQIEKKVFSQNPLHNVYAPNFVLFAPNLGELCGKNSTNPKLKALNFNETQNSLNSALLFFCLYYLINPNDIWQVAQDSK